MPENLPKIVFYGLVLGFSLPAAAQIASFNSLDGTVLKALVLDPPMSSDSQANQAGRH